jgi:effector-binding domain-containing protein
MAENALVRIDESHWDVLRLAGTLDEKRKHIFLRVLAETANLKIAAEAAGYRTTAAVNRLRKEDPSFDAAVIEAAEAAADIIESEATRRAVQGIKKAIYYKGEIIDYELVYSDSLLQLLLKAAKPDKYADRSQQKVDVTGKIGVAVIPMAAKSLAAWERESELVHQNQKHLTEPVIEGEFTEVAKTVRA